MNNNLLERIPMPELRGSKRTPPYMLSEHDVDLQDDPPATGLAARGKDQRARDRALALLNTATGLNLTMADFTVTKTALGDTGPDVPVEWKCERTVGNGTRTRHWTVMVDMDDVPPGTEGAGPDRPHVGYSYWSTGHDPVDRVNGHVFIEYVPASR